ncbi:serpentine type 7TM GPCR chemoreceptor srh domain-containing protein [Ditylenchus destructor]|uniref:Serpentine type 7TM GPCR chemoreceptor srh domain-containing protein n=1 Tax=Ditylenchus destructor TaxID=166010 RepID=A0AAD4MUC9_9BILA|nr:serpentine type 7TM GPCR chemoreceptor srh domain-containing protein [Ditylenchus destructor]
MTCFGDHRSILSSMDEYGRLADFITGYRIFLITTATITTAIYVFLLILIFLKTPTVMEKYVKYNLINITTSTWMQLVVVAVWQPIPLFNFKAGFSAGPIQYIPLPYITESMSLLMLALMFNLSLALLISFIHQYSTLRPHSTIGKIFDKNYRACGLYILYSVIIYFLLAMLIFSMHIPSQEFENQVKSDFNGTTNSSGYTQNQLELLLLVYKNQPTLSKYSIASIDSKIYLVLVIIIITSVATMTAWIIGKIMRKIYSICPLTQHPVTNHLHSMVFRTLCLSSLTFLLFFIVPGIIMPLGAIGLFPTCYPVMVMYLLIALQAPAILINVLVTIRPYRRCVVRMISKMTTILQKERTSNSN